MKLVLKRLAPDIDVTSHTGLDPRFTPSLRDRFAPFALHTESGEVLPCQVSTTMRSEVGQPVRLTVVFNVDGDKLLIEGDGL